MTKSALIPRLAAWAGNALRSGGEHCVELRPRFRIPGAGSVDLLSVRHSVRDHFSVGIWSIEPGPLDDAHVDALTRRIHAFEAWYGEFREHAETQGFNPGHRIRVYGNLVGRSLHRTPLLRLLSNWGCGMTFWTWMPAGAGIELVPCFGKAPVLKPERRRLKELLGHLPWIDGVERGTPAEAGVKDATPS